MAITSTLEFTTLDETTRCASKWFILTFLKILSWLISKVKPIPLS